MPAFIHDRAEHILAKNPSMDKSQAFAIATQQSHAVGKSPKGYGTVEGKRTAKKKYPHVKEYTKGANPGKLGTPKLEPREKRAFIDSEERQALLEKSASYLHELRKSKPLNNGMLEQDQPDPTDQSYGDEQEEVKTSYAVSAYSGPLSYGRFKQESSIPPFRSPPVKTAGPPSSEGKEKKAYDPSPLKGPGTLGNVDVPGMRKMQTPAKQLMESKPVAQVKMTKPDAGKALSIKLPGIGTTV